jgi:hypothetical protein
MEEALPTFVEVEGAVLRNPCNGQPIGTRLGVAVEDDVSGQSIAAFEDPQGLRFYASFAAAPDQATTLPQGQQQIAPINLLDTSALAAGSSVTVNGSFSRSAAYSSTLQFYAVLDEEGAVSDPVSGLPIRPGQPGYRERPGSGGAALLIPGAHRKTRGGGVLRLPGRQ